MSGAPLKLAVIGVAGRMGRTLLESARADARVVVSAATERADWDGLGADAGTLIGAPASGVAISADLAGTDFDVAIDFTRPASTLVTLERCRASGKALVIGTTGFAASEKAAIEAAAAQVPVVLAPNMSVGVNVTFKLIELAARALGEEYDVEVIEAHHHHKVDAPSGTALRMGEVLAGARGRDLAECAVFAREGHTGERAPGSIGFATVRAGDIVGEHTVLFAGPGERLEVVHRASSRDNYARGALRAALWLQGRGPGLYSMQDVLDLR